MRKDTDFMIFCDHPEWYTTVKYVGYVPTEKAPPEAVEAMERVNKRLKEEYEEDQRTEM